MLFTRILLLFAALILVATVGCGGDDSADQGDNADGSAQANADKGAESGEPDTSGGANGNNNPPAGFGDAETGAGNTNSLTDEEKAAARDEAMGFYDQAINLIEDAKFEEGYAAAKEAMQKFIEADDDLSTMTIETIDTEKHHIVVIFNMGPEERRPPAEGVANPLSFRVHTPGEDGSLIATIDFEITWKDAAAQSAAIGMTAPSGRQNYGSLPVAATYEQIRAAVLDVLNNTGGQ